MGGRHSSRESSPTGSIVVREIFTKVPPAEKSEQDSSSPKRWPTTYRIPGHEELETSDRGSSSSEPSPRSGLFRRPQSESGSVFPLKSLKDLAEKRAEADLEDSRSQLRKLDKNNTVLHKEVLFFNLFAIYFVKIGYHYCILGITWILYSG